MMISNLVPKVDNLPRAAKSTTSSLHLISLVRMMNVAHLFGLSAP